MLTKNGKLMTRIYCDDLASMSSVSVKNTDGNTVSIGAGYTVFGRVAVGSSDADFDKDDYVLEDANNDNLGLTFLSSDPSYNHNYEDGYIATFNSTYINNTANVIVVKEIGVYMHYTSSPISDYMIAREVGSDVYREIQPGETATFTITIG